MKYYLAYDLDGEEVCLLETTLFYNSMDGKQPRERVHSVRVGFDPNEGMTDPFVSRRDGPNVKLFDTMEEAEQAQSKYAPVEIREWI